MIFSPEYFCEKIYKKMDIIRLAEISHTACEPQIIYGNLYAITFQITSVDGGELQIQKL